jgi:predicted NBD/HSP70 family sugar kinase
MPEDGRQGHSLPRQRSVPDLDAVRTANRGRVLAAIRESGSIARVEIAKATGMSAGTVSVITAQLLEEGLIRQDLGEAEPGQPGRPKSNLSLDPQATFAIGLKLSLHQIAVSVTNYLGDIVLDDVVPVRLRGLMPEKVVSLCATAIDSVVSRSGIARERIAGVGIGVPGWVRVRSGMIHWNPIFTAREVPLRRMMEEATGLPVAMDNDANLVGLAELWFGVGRAERDFIVVTVEHGVGMALVLDRKIYRGSDGFAAELAHTKIEIGGALCRCGQRGCLEAYVADYAVMREAATFFDATHLDDPLAVQAAIEKLSAAVEAGDLAARDIFERAGALLGIGIANAAKIVNPSLVIIAGERARAPAVVFDAVRRSLAAQALVPGVGVPRVQVHRWGDELWARGAAALVLETFDVGR